MSINNKFLKRVKYFEKKESKYKKMYDFISTLRLVTIILALALTYIFIKVERSPYISYGMISSYALFIFLIIKHANISSKLKRAKCMIAINQKYVDRMNNKWVDFSDSGEENLDADYPYLEDLDIFGKESLFQLINTTNTFYGRKKLIRLLKKPEKNIEDILDRQEAVKELSEKIDFCQELDYYGQCREKSMQDPTGLLNYYENSNKVIKTQWIKGIIYILPIITILTFFLVISLKMYQFSYLLLFFAILHIVVCIIGFFKISPILNSLHKFKNDLESYANILALIEKEKFNSNYLKKLKSDLFCKDGSASKSIKKLNKTVDMIDLRYNAILYGILNIILLWDYRCLFSLEKWKDSYGRLVRKWTEVIAEFESVSSLAVLLQINPKWTFPKFTTQNTMFSAEEMGHPLIDDESRVCNDVNIKNNIFIVTGSNMSGKTTFLRTIGVNLILAYAGAPVCSKNLKCSIMDIFTSMRISDNLNEGLSTFYAELIRIKMIIEHLPKRRPMIFLIDEIFRGTNSKDRIIGAKNVIKHLSRDWVIGLMSTHDFELCDLGNRDKIKNYHFSESYSDGQIGFDYKLREGRSYTTNARYLMKMVGIEITE